jgi:uncharacterized protein (TIGR02453 family)
MSAFFTKQFSKFFIDLAPNNNKEWFDENRSRYENDVKKPFHDFTEQVIKAIAKLDPRIKISTKEAIFRINRDIRFSKDKYPYKMHMAAAISPAGKKDPDVSGFYFQLGPEGIQIWQGAYFIENTTLPHLREYLAANLKTFQKHKSAKKFVDTYGEIQGDGNSRVSKELKLVAEKEPLLLHKNLYWGAQLPASHITSDKLLQSLIDHYKAGKDLGMFLEKGMGR